MALALAAIVGFVVYHFVSASPASPTASSSGSHVGATTRNATKHHPKPTPSPAQTTLANDVVIRLSATENCWVMLTTASGKQIYEGIVSAGTSKHWTEKQPVSLMLGNPEGVALTVNGRNPVPAGSTQPVTLSLGPGTKTSS